jgi:hypothetical protein
MGNVFNLESRKTGRGFTRTLPWNHDERSGTFTGMVTCSGGRKSKAPRCFQWVKKEDRGKSGTHELMKRNGGK